MSKYKDGVSCGHKGCLNHVTHPCEGCNRIKGVNDYVNITWKEGEEFQLRFDGSVEHVHDKILEE